MGHAYRTKISMILWRYMETSVFIRAKVPADLGTGSGNRGGSIELQLKRPR
ncbi:MAG: hypothetical protein SRB2_04177 [Desulfobacteraceae bacterium Eth-SRB2]|nr:MAG: hypothetical protein SRB2_04177 [Desulfobacteraceae bacterium Eth-SRB2]